jgi:signal transduction histidine kinase/ActR/RegA family two-component response regulator
VSDINAAIDAQSGRPLPLPVEPRTRIGRWWLDQPLRKKGAVLTAVPLVVAVAALGVAMVVQQRQADLRNDLSQGTNSLIEASQIVEAIAEAESAVRGYAATRDQALLSSYDAAVASVPGRLQVLVAEAPAEHAGDAEEVAETAERALLSLEDVRAELTGPSPGLQDTAGTLAPATAAVDEATARADVLRLELLSDLATGVGRSQDLQSQSMWVLVVGLLAVVATSLAGRAIIARSIVGRTERLSENITRYWAGERLKPIVAAGDELGHLTKTLGEVAMLLTQHHEQVSASRDDALAATRAKDEFLSRMSHELRTPLTAIIGFGQLLQMEDLGEDDSDSVDHIVRAGNHLLALINEILDIAKIEAGQLPMSMEPVVLSEVADEAVVLVERQAAERSVTVSAAPMDGIAVDADRHRLQQVLLNLLTNAVKYNRRGGHIDVACRVVDDPGPGDGTGHLDTTAGSGGPTAGPEGSATGGPTTGSGGPTTHGRIRVWVTDTGPGIEPHDVGRLFEPFERLGAGDRGIDGTGVGLALTKGLVEAMGGAIGVTSEPGVGSTFWFELPRAEATPATAPPERPRRLEVKETGGPVVLCVEDNLANLRFMQRLFRDRRERLEVAVQGQQGIDIAREIHPDLVLLDLNLPDLDGDEVLAGLKSDPATADIPVVIISADATPRRREELIAAGAVDYLAKPVQVTELLDLLDRLALDASAPEDHPSVLRDA